MVAILTDSDLARIHDLAKRLQEKGLSDESKQLLQIVESGGRPQEVSASRAAEIFHVTSQTIRNWVRAGLLKGRVDAFGRYYVDLREIEPTLAMRAAQPKLPAHLYDVSDDDIVDALKEARARRRAIAER